MATDYYAQEVENSAPSTDYYAQEVDSNTSTLGDKLSNIAKGVGNIAKFATTGMTELTTGKSLKDRMFEARAQNIQPSTTAPFNANVENARNPINQLYQVGSQAAAGMAGEMADNYTSPLGLALGGAGLARSAAVQAGKLGDAVAGSKFDTLTKGYTALDAIKAKGQHLGKDVGDFFKGPLGDVHVPVQPLQETITSLPKPIQTSLGNAAKKGIFEMAPDGTIAPTVRNVHQMRMIIDDTIKEPSFQSLAGASEAQKSATTAYYKLGNLINNTTPQVRAVNGPFSHFREVSDPIVDQMADKYGRPRLGPLTNIISGKSELANIRDLKDLRQQIPELDILAKTLKGEARWKAVKGLGGTAAKKVGELTGLKLTFPGTAAEVEGGIP